MRKILNEDTKDSIIPFGGKIEDYIYSLTPVEQKSNEMFFKKRR